MDDDTYLVVMISLAILLVIVVGFKMFIPTQEEMVAQKELCLLEKELKYPEAANNTINRLCELEEMGRRQ